MTAEDKMMEALFSDEEGLTEKQKKILVAATEAFAEKGYASTSTSEIAKKAGVAEGTIFRHYKTKKELLFAIVTPTIAKLIAPFVIKDLNKVLNHDYENYEDFIKALIHNRVTFLKNNMFLFRILIQEIPFHPELKEQFKEHIASKVFERIRQIIEHYKAKGQIIDLPADTIIRFTASTIFGYLISRYILIPEAEWDDEAEIERTVKFLMNGLAHSNS